MLFRPQQMMSFSVFRSSSVYVVIFLFISCVALARMVVSRGSPCCIKAGKRICNSGESPSYVVVGGTGSSADAIWPFVEEFGGKSAYWWDDNYNNYLYWGDDKWYIDIYSPQGELHAHNNSTGLTPPKTGWIKDSGTLNVCVITY